MQTFIKLVTITYTMGKFEEICKKIKSLEIQGAENIAKAGLVAYSLDPSKDSIKKLLSLRPTEPCLANALRYAEKYSTESAFNYLEEADAAIAKIGAKLVRGIVYTHCHSSTVNKVLSESNKKFKVNCTETRPMFQGRITAKELADLNVPVTLYVDSAMRLAIKKANVAMIGADSITVDGEVINKIGSELAADTCGHFRVPLYIITNSWKLDLRSLYSKEVPIEQRPTSEVWDKKPKGIKIMNPAFEKIKASSIKAIVSELGILSPKEFVKKAIGSF